MDQDTKKIMLKDFKQTAGSTPLGLLINIGCLCGLVYFYIHAYRTGHIWYVYPIVTFMMYWFRFGLFDGIARYNVWKMRNVEED